MKTNNRWFIILIVIIIGLVGCNIYLKYNNDKLTKENNTKEQENANSASDKEEKYYDCSFTRTYRVVDLLDGYIAEVPEVSYVVVDIFQAHGAYAHIISSEDKKKLEVNKYYEFTYTLKGVTKDKIEDIDDVLKYLSFSNNINSDNSLKVLVDIKETNKKGLEQLHEKICEGK